ncbi:MAG: hypothetical protein JXR71_07895 [Bacteroidales bacterium]|nr:hypothetical protein [Bacteroidales bacterium]
MNKIKILGIIVLLTGIIVHFWFEKEVNHFLTGLLVGGGIGLLVTGQFRSRNT